MNAVDKQHIERVRRWQFIGILNDNTEVELTGLPFISADEDAIRKESRRRAIKFDLSGKGWVKDVIIQAV